MAEVSLKNFKPNFIPSSTSHFYVEVISFGSKISNLKDKLLFIGSDKKRLLIKNIEIDIGDIEISELSYTSFFKIEFPKSWRKPEEITITFIDDDKRTIYNFFQEYIDLIGLNKFRGIKIKNLADYSIEILVTRYDRFGNTVLQDTYTIFPKSIPKDLYDYESDTLQVFSIPFIIVDYQMQKS